MYIKDTETGMVRPYGTDKHDSLVKSEDGKSLFYQNLQNGQSSQLGAYLFCEKDGKIPGEIDTPDSTCYFNIGGFEKHARWIKEGDKYKCSNCGITKKIADGESIRDYKFCSRCGYEMERNTTSQKIIELLKNKIDMQKNKNDDTWHIIDLSDS